MYLLMARWVSRPVAVCLCVVWLLGTVAVLHEYTSKDQIDWRGLMAGFPLLALLGYGCLIFAFNRTHIRVFSKCIEIRNGPLPALPRKETIRFDEIDFGYYRLILVPGRFGASRFYGAGVRLRSGTWRDIVSTFGTLEQAQAAAERIAARVSEGAERTIQVMEVSGRPQHFNGASFKRLIGWSMAFVVTLLWGVLVDGV